MGTRYLRALSIAGSDSGGGAGIQADLKTFSALGCYGMTVITALTAQNTTGVSGIHPVPPEFVEKQLDAVFSDIGADAVKIGMLYSAELIEKVAFKLRRYNAQNIVLDPVMVATSGDKLLQDDAVEAIIRYLMPLAAVVTPNLPEASILVNRDIVNLDQIREAARELATHDSKAALIKGGHLAEGESSSDLLYIADEKRFLTLEDERIRTANTHGTGCTLSSAIAAYLARGLDLANAVKRAKTYVTEAIRAGARYEIGKGHGPVKHFYRQWDNPSG